MAYQRAYFPTKYIYLGQGYGILSKTHKNGYQLDLSGEYTLFAPFDCKVSKLYVPKKKDGSLDTSHSFEVWLTSTKKVLCCNGVYDYLTISITHPYDIHKLKLDQEFKQFESLKISTRVMTGTNDGKHAHIELSLGKKAGWDKEIIEKKHDYVNVNAVKPEKYLFITEDTKVLKDTYRLKTYKFIKESSITYKVVGVPSEPLYIRDKNNKIIGNLYNGDNVIKFDNNTKCLVYHYEVLGYTYKKYLKKA
jgi:hypothetical protein